MKREARKPWSTIAVTGAEKDQIVTAARVNGDSPTAFVRDAALKDAKRVLVRDRKAKAKGGEG